jgi:hypothetical protein
LTTPDFVAVGLRCHIARLRLGYDPKDPDATPEPRGRPRSHRPARVRQSRLAALDTETVTAETLTMPDFDPTCWPPEGQGLLFGHFRLAEHVREDDPAGARLANFPDWRIVVEILFYDNKLPASAIALLQRIHRERTWRMGDGREPRDLPGVRSSCWPLARFLEWFYTECLREPTLICGFNVPYDLTRIASSVGPAQTASFRGGFSCQLWPNPKNPDAYNAERPRVWIKSLGTAEPLLAFGVENRRGRGKLKDQRISTKTNSELWDLQRYLYYRTGDVVGLARAAKVLGLGDVKERPERHGVIDAAYVGYSRQDTAVTLNLALAALADVDRNDWSRGNVGGTVSEARLVSPASGAKRNLDAMGVRPRLELQPDFDPKVLGAAMEGFFGGQVLTPIRGEVPLVYCDITSCYPSVAILMQHWSLWTAQTIEVVEVTEEMRAFLATATRDDAMRPEIWPWLNCLCLTDVNEMDLLPVRYQADTDSSEWSLSRTHSGPRRAWYYLPDLLGSKILTGKTPNVLHVLRFVGVGTQSTLKPIKLGGVVDFDPPSMDYFKVCVEERYRVSKGLPPYADLSEIERDALAYGLKLSSNAAAYGLSVEVNRQRLATTHHRKQVERVGVWTGSTGDNECALAQGRSPHPISPERHCPDAFFAIELHTIETAGSHYAPFLGAAATSGARLLVALAESLARDLPGGYRGTVALSDTDSVGFVAAPERRTIQVNHQRETLDVMSLQDVASVREQLNALNPFDKAIISDLLKLEDVNFVDNDPAKPRRELWADVIGPKRYGLYTRAPGPDWPADLPLEWAPEDRSRRTVVEWKESALGGYLPPAKGADEKPLKSSAWRQDWWQAHVRGERCPFGATPAVKRATITSWDVLRRFASFNQGKPYAQQIKAFNFLLTLREVGNGHYNRTLIAPYDPDPDHWLSLPWLDYRTGERVPITLEHQDAEPPHAVASVVCWDTVWRSYFDHPVLTMRDGLGRICRPSSRGMLTPRRVQAAEIVYLGKESRELSRQEADLPPDEDGANDEYGRVALRGRDEWTMVRAIIRDDLASFAANLQIDHSTLSRWVDGIDRPDPDRERAVLRAVSWHAYKVLESFGLTIPDHRPNRLATYLEILPTVIEQTLTALKEHWSRGQRTAASDLDVPRTTLRRWIARQEAIPVKHVRRLSTRLAELGWSGAVPGSPDDAEVGVECPPLAYEPMSDASHSLRVARFGDEPDDEGIDAELERQNAAALAAWEESSGWTEPGEWGEIAPGRGEDRDNGNAL